MIILKNLKQQSKYLFGTESLNIRISDKDPLSREKIDKHLDRYGHLFRAFVLKRRLTRSEIWPKIHIIDDVPHEQQQHLKYQRLFQMKKSMKDEVMMTIAKNDPSKINSSFIISIFCEDYFKEMMDQYTSKILVCGKAPKDNSQYQQIQSKVMNLYHSFFFGEKRTALQRQIQIAYLSAKQFKSRRFQAQRQSNKNEFQECIWTQRDQRILQQKQNWVPADTNLTDLNYRTYFQPFQYTKRGEFRLKFQKLYSNWNFFDSLKFKISTRHYYDATSRQYYQWIQQKLFVRIMNHIKSLEFTSSLNIPHDYMIQAQLIQIHFWLIISRLNDIGTIGSKILARRLAMTLNAQVVRSARSVNLKKSNILIASLERMLEINSNILELHFNKSQVTKNNPYKGIDAMVWSIAFAEKVHRYADQIYLFGEYLIKNHQHIKRHSEQDLMNGIIEFDPFLVDPRYRQIIEKINPPLSPQEFEKQFNSNSEKKDYYYSNIQYEMQQQMPLQKAYQATSKVNTSFSFSQLFQPLTKLQTKYFTLRTMDHYNSMEQKKKQNQQFDKKGTWRSQKDAVEQVHEDFSTIHNLKNQRRRKNLQTDQKE